MKDAEKVICKHLECVVTRSTPTITLNSSDREPLSCCISVNIQMDGHKMIMDSGEVDISLAKRLVLVIFLFLKC